jgi:hypothetical protein
MIQSDEKAKIARQITGAKLTNPRSLLMLVQMTVDKEHTMNKSGEQ